MFDSRQAPHRSRLRSALAPVLGSLAVLGPTRMDYQNAKAAVSYIAGLFDRILNDAE